MSVTITINNNMSYVQSNCPESIDVEIYPADQYREELRVKYYPFELNLSNSNFFALFKALGLEADYCGQISATEFYNRVNTIYNPKQITSDSRFSQEPNKCAVYSCGRTLEQVTRYKWELLQIASEAKKRNEPITWS